MTNHFFNRTCALKQAHIYFYLIMLVLSVMLPEGCAAPESKVARNEKGEKNFGQSISVSDLDSLYSEKVLGCTVEANRTTFRLFAPRATKVQLVIFKTYTDTAGEPVQMTRDSDGVWEHIVQKSLTGSFYGYRVSGPEGGQEMFNDQIVIADPYSKAVCTQNTYRHPAKTLILDTSYDWQGDTFVISENHNDLIIYESHVRDLTMHPSSGIEKKGTYAGLTQSGKTGGLSYLKDLGINALELLPVHKFGAIELPFKDSLTLGATGLFNTWNPYERNHWGYMTSYFFAPESYYAEGGNLRRGEFSGTDGREVKEMKDMVKALHKEKIAVILDVVYNHVSQYDYNPYKYIDKMYYFHTDGAGNFKGESGCGNDFKTDRLMARRMIVESVKYWMTEYHIDGFRFDLAAMIDWETCKLILEEARKINPNVILIAEPWGGGKYAPDGFSDIGWAAWNDQFRNGVKGQNTTSGHGFIFGKKQGTNSQRTFQSFLTGTLQSDSGLFAVPQHAINYLESHDDNTMSDFIRIATGEAKEGFKVKASNFKLSERQLALNKLAALYLFAAQGPVMIHEGQEFARSKVVAATTAMDTKVGTIDHNSYEKDNETNYLNYEHRESNRDLYDYYRGLVALRKAYPSLLGSAPKARITFAETKSDFMIACRITAVANTAAFVPPVQTMQTDVRPAAKSMMVLLNGHQKNAMDAVLPAGNWRVLANAAKVSTAASGEAAPQGKISVPPVSGMILIEE